MLSAKDIKKIQDVVLQIEDQQRCLSKSDPKELNKALRRETYRISKKQGLKIQQVDGHIVQRRALGDITNVRQPKLVTSDDFNVTKDNAALTEEERKREKRTCS
ncbi:uncharacterized protein LOC125507545 [Triticum urartu]|uniref:uncharacterized protein LOC125507545 n=1 Tax=Triticum urartu TaxID=4572 RepID=UPI002043778E|nr:uncharacterized protein LOC125507545 [Triticum urartu]